MKSYIKSENGITIVALVITIIVMLLLAGVTLNYTLNNGILTKAVSAKFESEVAAVIEKWNLERAAKELKDIPYTSINYNTIEEALPNYNVPESLKSKLKIVSGNIVYIPSEFSEEERNVLESLKIFAE